MVRSEIGSPQMVVEGKLIIFYIMSLMNSFRTIMRLVIEERAKGKLESCARMTKKFRTI